MGPLIVVTFLLYAWLEHTVLSNKEISWSFRIREKKKKELPLPCVFMLGQEKVFLSQYHFWVLYWDIYEEFCWSYIWIFVFLFKLNCLSPDTHKTLLCKWMFCELTCIILKRNPLTFYISINNTLGRVKAWYLFNSFWNGSSRSLTRIISAFIPWKEKSEN